ncbi:hypothetical protein [Vibrio sp. DNB22_19_1]
MDYLQSPYLWSLIFSVASFLATEFFFPISDESEKKKRHFWSIAIFIIMLFQSFVVSNLFLMSDKIDTKISEIDSKIDSISEVVNTRVQSINAELENKHKATNKNILGTVKVYSQSNDENYEKIDSSLNKLSTKIGTVTGFEDVTGYTKVRVLEAASVSDTKVVYDTASGKFPILEQERDEAYWVRLLNTNLVERPVVEIRIDPQLSNGQHEGTEFVFGVSENILRILSGGKDVEQLRLEAKIVKRE